MFDNGANGLDHGFRRLVGDAVVTVRHDDLAALRGEVGEGGLELVNPGFVEFSDLTGGDGVIVGFPVSGGGENDDRHVAEIGDVASGRVDFGIATATDGQNGAILRGGACLSAVGLLISDALVAEGLSDGVVVGSGKLRRDFDGIVAHEETNQAKTGSDRHTPAEKFANGDGHTVDSCQHDWRLILIGIGGIDEDKAGDFGRIAAGVNAREAAADGMADENVGPWNGSAP